MVFTSEFSSYGHYTTVGGIMQVGNPVSFRAQVKKVWDR